MIDISGLLSASIGNNGRKAHLAVRVNFEISKRKKKISLNNFLGVTERCTSSLVPHNWEQCV